jgi:hypothetical protein
MTERGRSYKEVVNDTLRAGLGSPRRATGYRGPTFNIGFDPTVPWGKALQISAALEDDELIRRLAALALEHGAEIVSFDHDFSRFPGLRWRSPG